VVALVVVVVVVAIWAATWTCNKMLNSSFLFWQGHMKIGEARRNGF
jgi:4-amino-4-deoxy-L-arabinose transferase-like glycosyltransferase